MVEFEWDEEKRQANLEKHRVDFVDAARLLLSDTAKIHSSSKSGSDDTRYIAVGPLDELFYTAIFTIRNGKYRIISARRANRAEEKKYREYHSTRAAENAKLH